MATTSSAATMDPTGLMMQRLNVPSDMTGSLRLKHRERKKALRVLVAVVKSSVVNADVQGVRNTVTKELHEDGSDENMTKLAQRLGNEYVRYHSKEDALFKQVEDKLAEAECNKLALRWLKQFFSMARTACQPFYIPGNLEEQKIRKALEPRYGIAAGIEFRILRRKDGAEGRNMEEVFFTPEEVETGFRIIDDRSDRHVAYIDKTGSGYNLLFVFCSPSSQPRALSNRLDEWSGVGTEMIEKPFGAKTIRTSVSHNQPRTVSAVRTAGVRTVLYRTNSNNSKPRILLSSNIFGKIFDGDFGTQRTCGLRT
jgi:hypothetical protein